jgi:hypothetical protein
LRAAQDLARAIIGPSKPQKPQSCAKGHTKVSPKHVPPAPWVPHNFRHVSRGCRPLRDERYSVPRCECQWNIKGTWGRCQGCLRQGLGRWFSKFAVLKADISNPPRNGEVARSDGGVPTPHLHGPSRPWGPSAPLGHLPVPGGISADDKFLVVCSAYGRLQELTFVKTCLHMCMHGAIC